MAATPRKQWPVHAFIDRRFVGAIEEKMSIGCGQYWLGRATQGNRCQPEVLQLL